MNESHSIGHYADTRNGLMGAEYSSKLSPWLANGSLSVREVYWAATEYMDQFGSYKSVEKFIDELWWREFCRYWCVRH